MQRITFLAALLVVIVLFSTSVLGQSPTGAGYNLNDYQVRTAKDLLNICTVDSYHTDYNEARSFCYGYLEGGRAYHDGLVVLDGARDRLTTSQGESCCRELDVRPPVFF